MLAIQLESTALPVPFTLIPRRFKCISMSIKGEGIPRKTATLKFIAIDGCYTKSLLQVILNSTIFILYATSHKMRNSSEINHFYNCLLVLHAINLLHRHLPDLLSGQTIRLRMQFIPIKRKSQYRNGGNFQKWVRLRLRRRCPGARHAGRRRRRRAPPRSTCAGRCGTAPSATGGCGRTSAWRCTACTDRSRRS